MSHQHRAAILAECKTLLQYASEQHDLAPETVYDLMRQAACIPTDRAPAPPRAIEQRDRLYHAARAASEACKSATLGRYSKASHALGQLRRVLTQLKESVEGKKC